MSSLLETITRQLGGDRMKEISRGLNADEGATKQAIGAALPTLLGALARNTSKPEEAEALHRAVEKDHDGSVLDNIQGLLSDPKAGPGDGILRHVLGGRRERVETGISRASGLDEGSTNKLMTMLAPMVMGALGKQQREKGLDAGGMAKLLGQEREEATRKIPGAGLLDKLLDSDGDGDVDMGDFVKRGAGLLGKLTGRR